MMRTLLHSLWLPCCLWILCTPAATRALDEATKEVAARRFDRGLRLVEQGDLSGALAEFLEVQSLAPRTVVLYNLGLLYALLERPVEAVDALRGALQESNALSAEQVDRAEHVLSQQSVRIGFVNVHASTREGTVEVDNVQVAELPLAGPLPVASGPRVIGVVVQGHAPARKEVVVAGEAVVDVALDLVPIDGRLAHIELNSRVPGADVFVDGERVGSTPLEASITVTPGTRTVLLKRAGYRPAAHSVTLTDGARTTISLQPEIDVGELAHQGGELLIEPSEPLSVASIDAAPQGTIRGPLRLPFGPHRVRVERGGFEPAERDVVVPRATTLRLPVALDPTPTTRAQYIEDAQRARRLRGSMLAVSGLGLAAGVTMGMLAGRNLVDARDTLREVQRDSTRGANGSCDFSGIVPEGGGPAVPLTDEQERGCLRRLDQATSKVDRLEAFQIVGWSLAGASALGALTAGIMLLRSDDPERYERRTPQLQPVFGFARGSGHIGMRGRF